MPDISEWMATSTALLEPKGYMRQKKYFIDQTLSDVSPIDVNLVLLSAFKINKYSSFFQWQDFFFPKNTRFFEGIAPENWWRNKSPTNQLACHPP